MLTNSKRFFDGELKHLTAIRNFLAKDSAAADQRDEQAGKKLSRMRSLLRILSNHPITCVFFTTFVICLLIFRPGQYYFYGDSCGVLYAIVSHQKTVFVPHNYTFIPLFKLLYLLEYRLFGGNHLPYMIVGLTIHAGVATSVYKLGRQFSLPISNCVAALCMFALSSVHWE